MEHISGYFNDDGTPLNPDLIPTPQLCLSCSKNEDVTEEILCNLNRLDQTNEKEFICFAYQNKYSK
jgi:nitrate/TMAO reductase-like tetraheme cytochrome c subunit